MFYIKIGNGGRVGNNIFRYLTARLFCILYNAIVSDNNEIYYYQFHDIQYIDWMNSFLHTNTLPNINFNINLEGYYQHDILLKKYLQELITYIHEHPNDKIDTFKNEFVFHAKDILGPLPDIHFSYKTVIHLRVEDFLGADMGMHPESIDAILQNLSGPFVFVHKPCENNIDIKYVSYFKNKYPNSIFYTDNVLNCYNLMRHSTILVCSRSTLSWIAALFNEQNGEIYMPINNNNTPHESFQYPNNNTKLYEWKNITKDAILQLE